MPSIVKNKGYNFTNYFCSHAGILSDLISVKSNAHNHILCEFVYARTVFCLVYAVERVGFHYSHNTSAVVIPRQTLPGQSLL